jgi:hypothetical protein
LLTANELISKSGLMHAASKARTVRPSTTINIYYDTATSNTEEMVAGSLDELVTPVSLQLHTPAHDAKSLPVRKA